MKLQKLKKFFEHLDKDIKSPKGKIVFFLKEMENDRIIITKSLKKER